MPATTDKPHERTPHGKRRRCRCQHQRRALLEQGHEDVGRLWTHNPIPVAPKEESILGRKVFSKISDGYRQGRHRHALCRTAAPSGAVRANHRADTAAIFNPGTENPGEYELLRAAGIEPIEACTLEMLRTNQF